MYKVESIPTLEKIEQYEEAGYFFRFHDPIRRMSSRSKSWGMIYSSAREAIANGSTVLEGKSCTETAWDLMQWYGEFDNSYVVVVFAGYENGYGHDDETVAIYDHKIDVFSYTDFVNLYEDRYIKLITGQLKEDY